MAFVELVAEPRDDVTRELFDTDLAQRGYVPNFTRLFAHRPGVYPCFFSKTLDALAVEPDEVLGAIEPSTLRDALAVGRQVA